MPANIAQIDMADIRVPAAPPRTRKAKAQRLPFESIDREGNCRYQQRQVQASASAEGWSARSGLSHPLGDLSHASSSQAQPGKEPSERMATRRMPRCHYSPGCATLGSASGADRVRFPLKVTEEEASHSAAGDATHIQFRAAGTAVRFRGLAFRSEHST